MIKNTKKTEPNKRTAKTRAKQKNQQIELDQTIMLEDMLSQIVVEKKYMRKNKR